MSLIVVVTAILGRGRGAAPHTPDFIGLGAGFCLQVADGLLATTDLSHQRTTTTHLGQ